MLILKTSRFILREFITSDASEFYLLNLDPDVIRYTGDKSFKDINEATQFLHHYDHYKKYGFGRWAVIDKIRDKFTGWCGLKYTPEVDEIDIGFRFYKMYWNNGYATETAKASIDYGFNELGLSKIVGRVMKENSASIKVLEKIGMIPAGNISFMGYEGLKFVIEK
jgi:[ribosomal protein S5]-alanine N-acetyltransferase